MSPLVMLSQHLVYLVLTSVIALVVMQAPDTLDKVMRALSVVRCITALDNIAIMGCCFLCGGILLAVKNSMGSCTTTARVDPLLTEADEPEEDMPTPSEARNFFQRICEAVTPAATQAVKSMTSFVKDQQSITARKFDTVQEPFLINIARGIQTASKTKYHQLRARLLGEKSAVPPSKPTLDQDLSLEPTFDTSFAMFQNPSFEPDMDDC